MPVGFSETGASVGGSFMEEAVAANDQGPSAKDQRISRDWGLEVGLCNEFVVWAGFRLKLVDFPPSGSVQ